MRKSTRETFITVAHSSSSPSLLLPGRRRTTPYVSKSQQKSLSQLTKEIIRSGIQAINIDRKYSILAVPKTPNKCMKTSKETTLTPNSKLDTSDNLSIAATDTTRAASNISEKRKITFTHKFSRIRSGYRFRKNPNQENLKVALQEIEKNPPNKVVLREKNDIKFVKSAENKSDIEILLESQGVVQREKAFRKKKSSVLDIEIVKDCRECKKEFENIDKSIDNESQKSDPSPVRERPTFNTEVRSQTPKKGRKSKKNINCKLKFFTSSKAGKEFMDKFQYRKEILGFATKEEPCSYIENINKSFLDYRQESLKILKDTSFFANKIMKGIRCPGRIKKCYY